jgi:hypothetical protein
LKPAKKFVERNLQSNAHREERNKLPDRSYYRHLEFATQLPFARPLSLAPTFASVLLWLIGI